MKGSEKSSEQIRPAAEEDGGDRPPLFPSPYKQTSFTPFPGQKSNIHRFLLTSIVCRLLYITACRSKYDTRKRDGQGMLYKGPCH